ncbi:MAG: hypothetical protein FWD17_08240 [Polyangiaceae bacterium]|nr:hypothetical protein [Polyangiaceae bacterium]
MACAVLASAASERAIAAYSRLRAQVESVPATDGGRPPRVDAWEPAFPFATSWFEVLELQAFEYRRAGDTASARRIYADLLARGRPAAVAAGHLAGYGVR